MLVFPLIHTECLRIDLVVFEQHVFTLVSFILRRNLITCERNAVLFHLNHTISSFMFLRVISNLCFGIPCGINGFFEGEEDVFIFVLLQLLVHLATRLQTRSEPILN